MAVTFTRAGFQRVEESPHRFLVSPIAINRPLMIDFAVGGLSSNVDQTSVRNLVEMIPGLPNIERLRYVAR